MESRCRCLSMRKGLLGELDSSFSRSESESDSFNPDLIEPLVGTCNSFDDEATVYLFGCTNMRYSLSSITVLANFKHSFSAFLTYLSSALLGPDNTIEQPNLA